MGVLETAVDPRSQSYLDARAALLAALAELEAGLDAAREGGGERAVTRHHARGKLLARERIELLVDRDSPLLELSPVAGWGTGTPVGAAAVTAIGMVADHPCLIVASDPTVRDGAVGRSTLRKILRGLQIAEQNRLPVIGLLEAVGTEPADQPEVLGVAAEVVASLARLAAAGIPTAVAFFGDSTALAGADLAHSFDYLIAGRPAPAGPGGVRPADHRAEDERDTLRLTRRCVQRFAGGLCSCGSPGNHNCTNMSVPPKHDPEDLLAVPVTEPKEILGRVLDGSEFDEDQPGYGPAVCTGWGAVHGHPVAILAQAAPASGGEEAGKAARFIRRTERTGVPLLLLRHGTALGSPAEAALAAATVPLVAVRTGTWQGVSAASGAARFRFAWPAADVAPAPAPGAAAEPESALERSGRLDDDGVIDPRDTRTVLGFCLSILGPAQS